MVDLVRSSVSTLRGRTDIFLDVIETSLFIDMKSRVVGDRLFGSDLDKVGLPDQSRQTKSTR